MSRRAIPVRRARGADRRRVVARDEIARPCRQQYRQQVGHLQRLVEQPVEPRRPRDLVGDLRTAARQADVHHVTARFGIDELGLGHHLQPVHVRHVEIHEHQLRLEQLGQPQADPPAVRHRRRASVAAEQLAETARALGIVIDHQDPQRLRR